MAAAKKKTSKKSTTKAKKALAVPAHPSVSAPRYSKKDFHLTYHVSVSEPWTHNIWIEIEIHRADLQGDLVLKMPTWTPGSYKLREFSRNVSHFEAMTSEGKALKHSMDDKLSWRVDAKDHQVVKVRYRLYSFELSVRTPHCDDTHCFFQPTNALMFVDGQLDAPCVMEITPYEGWDVCCPLPRIKGKGERFLAPNYDILADSPVEIGNHERYEFAVDGKRHEIVIYGFGNHDPDQMVKDFTTIVKQCKKTFGDLPYENYIFILHFLPNNRGGLEHLNSQVSAWDSLGFDTREGYEDFLSLISHEFFHTWNVKRIRPEILGPFDYTSEQYTHSLWVMEGVTVYYEWLQMVRAGMVTEERFLKALSHDVNRWEGRPGNAVMPLRESSFLAWTKLYLADENFANTGVSYYLKGGLVALLLDFEIRERSKGKKSLNDVMRLAYKRFGWPKPGFPEGGFEALVEEICPGKWKAWFEKHLNSTKPLDIIGALKKSGLNLNRADVSQVAADGKKRKVTIEPWLGWEVADKDGGVKVTLVRDDSPAQRGGVSAKDELLAIEGVRIRNKAQLTKLLKLCDFGESVNITLFSGDILRECDVEIGAEEAGKWEISVNEKAPAKAAAFRKAWLSN